MPVSSSFAKILASGRSHFNARVAEAKRRFPDFDSQIFADFLDTCVDPVIVAVSYSAPDRCSQVVFAAFDMAMTLSIQGFIGPGEQGGLLKQTWSELFPLLAKFIATSPQVVLGALSNAVIYLQKDTSFRGHEWLEYMKQIGPLADSVDDLLNLGKILAWRSGVVHFRQGALAIADTLPESLVLAALGAETRHPWALLKNKLENNPWLSPENLLTTGKEVGAFTGLGGRFEQPPELRACQSGIGFWVKSKDSYSLLMADAWGAVFLPATEEEFASGYLNPVEGPIKLAGNCLIIDDQRIDLDLPDQGLSFVCNEYTVAVTSIYSYCIKLFPVKRSSDDLA